jgi:K+-transporting ATPase ATPase C chain
MFMQIRTSLGALLMLTLMTGLICPLTLRGLGALLFPSKVEGSLLTSGDRVLGSSLLAQSTPDPKWFWPRPSAADHQTLPSGASNLAPSSKKLLDGIAQQRAKQGDVPAELLTTSGSGLDPDLSVKGAHSQLPRICKARGWAEPRCLTLGDLIAKYEELPTLGFLGRKRVNVNILNLALLQEDSK